MGTLKTNEEIKKEISEAMEELSWVVEGGDAHDLQDTCDKAHACLADTLALIERLESDASFYKNISALMDKTNGEALSLIDSLIESNLKRAEKIEQLKAQNAELSENIMWMEAERDDLKRTIQQLQTERDELMHWAKGRCDTCAHKGDCVKHDPDPEGYVMRWYDDCEIWEWRGVQKGECDV